MLPRPLLRLSLAGLSAALVLALAQPPARSCAPVYRSGTPAVRIATETALIVWDDKAPRDKKRGTQHFIRRGTFDTAAPDFGFLVPTPTNPEVAEADDDVFKALEKYTAPKIVDRHVSGTPPGMAMGRGMGAVPTMAPKAAVEVVGEGRVGQLDYSILHSTTKDPKPVLKWLRDNNYTTRDALDEWLKPYLDNGWYLTAFKFARALPSRSGLSTKAVRMTFGTDEPFYPYREPEDMRSPGIHPPRLLRLYVLADDRVRGTLGKDQPWSARTVWSDHLPADSVKADVLEPLKIDVTRDSEWSPRLTMFEDNVSPRYGIDEVYFSSSPDQSVVERIEYRDVYGMPYESAVPTETRHRLVIGTSIVAGALLLGLAGIALYFFLSGRPSPQS